MNPKPATPKDAASVILLNQNLNKVLWAQRNPKLKFLGGFHSFPGGKVDPDDDSVKVDNCDDRETARLIACAAREVFEEIGVLLARGGERLTKGQRASLHDDLISGRFTFSEILETWGLSIDADDFTYTDCWTTPEFSPLRFKTRFFLAVCPPKQKPYAAIDELRNIEFIEPAQAIELWRRSKALMAPPALQSLRRLVRSKDPETDLLSKDLPATDQSENAKIDHIELNSRLICLPLRTKTLPPATHTNCFIVGKREFVVIDAASKETPEQAKLFALLDKLIEGGGRCRAIIVSHLHPDHFGGETVLREHLRSKHQTDPPISAHRLTAESLRGKVEIEKFIEDQEIFALRDENGSAFDLKALHTPGHARGHLCFYDEEYGFLLSSDNVVGLGSVLIAPPEGNMSDYLRSLEKMRDLPGLNFLCGSHGPAISEAKGKIEEYIFHRLERERQIIEAVESGAQTPEEVARAVYQNLDPQLFSLAVESVRAHLAKISQEGYFKSDSTKSVRYSNL
ncbi:MAG: MBL fold metallo-hydrolase [Pyrinomonadaceae bacterium]